VCLNPCAPSCGHPHRAVTLCLPSVARALVVTDILGGEAVSCSRSLRNHKQADEKAVAAVAERIATGVGSLIAEHLMPEIDEDDDAEACPE
jgi:hypothetical protein